MEFNFQTQYMLDQLADLHNRVCACVPLIVLVSSYIFLIWCGFNFFFFFNWTVALTDSMQETVLVETNNALRSKVTIISKPNADLWFKLQIRIHKLQNCTHV